MALMRIGLNMVRGHMKSRTELVAELVRNPRISGQSIEALKAFGWDCESPLVTVQKSDIWAVLREFAAGKLNAADIQAWANRIEGRDDVAYEHGPDGPVNEAVFWLANPFINYPIDAAICLRIEKLFFDA